MPLGMCPVCDKDLVVPGKPRIGQSVLCSSCRAKLYVVWQEPLELDWVYPRMEEDEARTGLDAVEREAPAAESH